MAAEYNHGPTAVLKNALDYAYAEWGNKPVAFVGYGGVDGARAVEQLRLHAIELQMAPVRSAIHILFPDYLAVIKDGKPLSELEHLNQAARQMLDSWHGGPPPSKQRAKRVCARRLSRKKPMTITLNHTIVSARDKDAAARFFAEIFGLRFEGLGGHFAPVRVNDTLTLDFADAKGTIASQHYAFHVNDAEFDAILQRVKDAGLTFGSGPRSFKDGKFNDWNGGRGFYYKDNDGHVIELMTVPR
jgi:catechol 2,3-dioxygenase-like lactoylglutathione lyase family enzyme